MENAPTIKAVWMATEDMWEALDRCRCIDEITTKEAAMNQAIELVFFWLYDMGYLYRLVDIEAGLVATGLLPKSDSDVPAFLQAWR